MLGWQLSSLSLVSVQPFLYSLNIYLTAALSLCCHHSLCQVVLNFYGGAHFTCESWITLQTFVQNEVANVIAIEHHFSSEFHLSDSCAICCMVSPPQMLLPTTTQNAWLTQRLTGWEPYLMNIPCTNGAIKSKGLWNNAGCTVNLSSFVSQPPLPSPL